MIVHFVNVYLRSGQTVPIQMESADAARASVAYAGATWLRKCPQDRAGAWQMGAESTRVTDDGVGVNLAAVAMFDPREVVAVHAVARRVEEVA